MREVVTGYNFNNEIIWSFLISYDKKVGDSSYNEYGQGVVYYIN